MASSVDRTRRSGSLGAAAALGAGVLLSSVIKNPALAWLLTLGAFTAFALFIGVAINGRAAGLVIDNRNRVSLSKFQALAWSILVLSALMTGAIMRLRLGFQDAAGIAIPGELLAAMGISATSLVATPVILSLKSNDQPDPLQALATEQKLDNVGKTASAGNVYARADAQDAQWLDMFRGEEAGNAASPDLGKVQQFLITAVVLIVYGASLWKAFAAPQYLTARSGAPAYFSAFPALSTTVVWLIGISHAGYLAYKAAPHSQTLSPAEAAAAASNLPEKKAA